MNDKTFSCRRGLRRTEIFNLGAVSVATALMAVQEITNRAPVQAVVVPPLATSAVHPRPIQL
jgi:hypothetical protein